jgi:GNAT superfamily N-acetyltransferase
VSQEVFSWSTELPLGVIEFVYVAPPYRGRGIAPKLLRGAEEWLRSSGARRIEAHIDAHNAPSVRAFLAAGWVLTRMASHDFRATRLLADSEP